MKAAKYHDGFYFSAKSLQGVGGVGWRMKSIDERNKTLVSAQRRILWGEEGLGVRAEDCAESRA